MMTAVLGTNRKQVSGICRRETLHLTSLRWEGVKSHLRIALGNFCSVFFLQILLVALGVDSGGFLF